MQAGNSTKGTVMFSQASLALPTDGWPGCQALFALKAQQSTGFQAGSVVPGS